MFIAALICFAIALFITLTGVYSLACQFLCAIMLNPNRKPTEYKFTMHWLYNWGVTVLVLAGAILVHLS
mgnify:CR=1 FL=1